MFINQDTLDYPFYEGDVALNPELNWSIVLESPIPSFESDEVLEEKTPVYENGLWVQCWVVRPKTDSEKLADKVPPKFLESDETKIE